MKYKTLFFAPLALMLCSTTAWTQDDDAAEATIRLMGAAEAELPGAVTKVITLPQHLLDAKSEDQIATVDKAAEGLKNANENRKRREQGLTQADEARQSAAEMSNNAKENRENRGRSDPPGRPDNPGQP